MSPLPLQVDEVLEQEYVSMYGPLERVPVEYTPEQVVDAAMAYVVLSSCGMSPAARGREAVAALLNRHLESALPKDLESSPVISTSGKLVFELYDELISEVHSAGGLRELNRRLFDEALKGLVVPLRDLSLKRLYAALHRRGSEDPSKGRSALCLSGGGVRSATFALGVVEGLASARVLRKFDFISSVGGGGYLAGWLSAWARRHPLGMSAVEEDLATGDIAISGTSPAGAPRASTLRRQAGGEPPQVRQLRDACVAFAGDSRGADWSTAFAAYAHRLLMSMLVLIPLLAFMLALPRMFSYLLATTSLVHDGLYVWAASTCCTVAALCFTGQQSTRRSAAPRWSAEARLYTTVIVPLLGASVSLVVLWADITAGGFESSPIGLAALLLPPSGVLAYSLVRPRGGESGARRRIVTGMIKAQAAFIAIAAMAAGLAVAATTIFRTPPASKTLAGAIQAALYSWLAVPVVLAALFLATVLFAGMAGAVQRDLDRERWMRVGALLLAVAAGWLIASGITVFGPLAVYYSPALLTTFGGLSGILAAAIRFGVDLSLEGDDAATGRLSRRAAAALALPLNTFFVFTVVGSG